MSNVCKLKNFSKSNEDYILLNDITYDGSIADLAYNIAEKIKDQIYGQLAVDENESVSPEGFARSADIIAATAIKKLPDSIRKKLNRKELAELQSDIRSEFQTSEEAQTLHIIGNAVLNGDDDVRTETERRSERLYSFLQDCYGSGGLGLDMERRNRFASTIRQGCIINTKGRIIIDSPEALNESIMKIKNSYYKTIYNYLNTKHPGTINQLNVPYEIYRETNTGWIIDTDYNKLMLLMYNEIMANSKLQSDLMKGWNHYINNESDPFYEAFIAYINLNYFDLNLQDNLEDLLNIDYTVVVPITTKTIRTRTGVGYVPRYRYSINNSSGDEFWNWRDDILDATKVIGGYSKTLIKSIPVYDYHTNKLLQNSMRPNQFQITMIKLKQLGSQVIDTEFQEAIMSLYTEIGRKEGALQTIYEILFGKKAQPGTMNNLRSLGFDEDNFNVLYSFYNTVLEGDNSWSSIETEYANKKGIKSRMNTVDTLFNIIKSTTANNYVQTVWDSYDHKYVTKIKQRYPLDRSKNNIMRQVNYSTIFRTDQYENAQILGRFNPQDFQIKIGDTTFRIITTRSGRHLLNAKRASDFVIVEGTGTNIEGDVKPTEDDKLISSIETYINENLDTIEKQQAFYNSDKSNLKDKEGQQLKDILDFVDKTLYTGFSSKDGLRMLYLAQNQQKNFLKSLLLSATRSYKITDIYKNFREVKDGKERKYSDDQIFEYLNGEGNYNYSIPWKDVLRHKDDSKKQDTDEKPMILMSDYGSQLRTVAQDEEWLEAYAKIKSILYGDTSNAVTSNLSGNKIPNMSTAHLGGEMIGQFYRSQQTNGTPVGSLLFVHFPEAVITTCINSDIKMQDGTVKSISEMKGAELLYDSIINKFIIPFTENGRVYIQAGTYSDKTTFIQALVNTDKVEVQGETLRELVKFPKFKSSILREMGNTVGEYYINTYKNVIGDLEKVLGVTGRENIIAELHKLNEQGLIEKVRIYNEAHSNEPITIYKDLHYRDNGNLELNELLDYYANFLYAKDENGAYPDLAKVVQLQEIQFLHQLIQEGVGLHNNEQLRDFIKNVYSTANVRNDKKLDLWTRDKIYANDESDTSIQVTILGKIHSANGKVTDIIDNDFTINEGDTFELNPALEVYFLSEMLLSNNLRLSLLGTEANHLIKGKTNLFESVKNALSYKDDAKLTSFLSQYDNTVKNGYLSYEQLKTILYNPKFKHDSTFFKLVNLYGSSMIGREAKGEGAQLKRNVAATAPMTKFTPSMTGITSIMKVAFVDDMTADVFNIQGDRDKKHKVCDGHALVHPVWSILENNSLLDKSVGYVKKPLLHYYNERYGTSTLFKYATSSITNYWMRQSEGNVNGVRLYNIFKKMSNLRWHDKNGKAVYGEFNLTKFKSFKQNKLKFNDIIDNKKLYYRVGKNHYQITDLGYTEENQVYYTEENQVSNNTQQKSKSVRIYHYFDDKGNHVKSTKILNDSNLHTIDSVFELHAALGGIYTEHYNENGTWEFDEASNEIVAQYANNIVIPTKKFKTAVEFNQKNYRQPLKEAMIATLVNNSAVKEGAGNINPASVWTADDNIPLMYATVGTDQYGLQQDSDHPADEAQMTLFTQVISALDLGGQNQDFVHEIYKVLGEITLNASRVELDAMEKYLKSQGKDKNALYDIVGKTIINNFTDYKDSKYGLSSAIIKNVRKAFRLNENHALDYFKIPFSDNTIYQGFLSTVISNLNKKSIKIKFPGLATVMVPSYNMSMIYDINGEKLQYQDIVKRALEDADTPVATGTDDSSSYTRKAVANYLGLKQAEQPHHAINDLSEFYPTDNVWVEVRTTDGTEDHVNLNLENIDDYYNFKDNPTDFVKKQGELQGKKVSEILYFQKDVTRPRNLAPTRLSFEYNDNDVIKTINIYDHPVIKNLFIEINRIQNDKNLPDIAKKERISKARKDAKIDSLMLGIKLGSLNINGTSYAIMNINNTPPELIMSNIYKTAFGIRDGDSFADVIAQGENYFKESKMAPISDNYDIALIADNEPLYIRFTESQTHSSKNTTVGTWNNIKKERVTSNNTSIQNRIVALTEDNQTLYPVGYEIISTNVSYDPDTQTFINAEGHSVANQNLYSMDANGNVLEYHEIIQKTRYRERDGREWREVNGLDISMNEIRNLIRLENPNDSAAVIEKKAQDYLSKVALQVYENAGTEMLYMNYRQKGSTIEYMRKALEGIASNQEDSIMTNYAKELIEASKHLNATDDLNANIYSIDEDEIADAVANYYDAFAKYKYSSFVMSQYFTAGRIPAQNMSSFMAMQNVGWTGQSNGICYVSRWQTWLQGSDYDIDKAYIMGLAINGQGLIQGWSKLFDHSSAPLLRASMTLPFPSGLHYTIAQNSLSETQIKALQDKADRLWAEAQAINPWSDPDKVSTELPAAREAKLKEYNQALQELNSVSLNVTEYANQLREIDNQIRNAESNNNLIELTKLKSNRIRKEAEIIRSISKYDSMTQGRIGGTNIDEVLSLLNLHNSTTFSVNQRQNAMKNFVSLGIQNVVQDMTNINRAMIPGVLAELRDAADAQKMPADMKDAILLNPNTKFLFQAISMTGKEGVGVFANGTKALFNWMYYLNDILKNHKEKIPFIKFNVETSRIIGRFKGNMEKRIINMIPGLVTSNLTAKERESLGYILDPEITSDNAMSQMVTAATDNAKEQILGLINASPKLGAMYTFMIAMGFNLNDIVTFMSSPVARLIDNLTNDNVFGNKRQSVKGAINVAIGNIDSKSVINDARLKATRDSFLKDSGMTKEEIEADAKEFLTMYNGGTEISALAQFLSLNQGIPTTKAEILAKEGTLSRSVDRKVSLDKVYDMPLLNIAQWFDNATYREETIAQYHNNVRTAIDFLDVFESLDNFKAFRQIFRFSHYMDAAMSVKSRIANAIADDLRLQRVSPTEQYSKNMLTQITNVLTLAYMESRNDLKLPVKEGNAFLTSDGTTKYYDKDGEIDFSTYTSIANFKYTFEKDIIPLLKQGFIPSYENDTYVTKADPDLADNPFIKDIYPDASGDIPAYMTNLDMNILDNSPEAQTRFRELSRGLAELQGKYMNGIPLSDWFSLYNIITSKNASRFNSMTPLFDAVFSANTENLMYDYLRFMGNVDAEGKIYRADQTLLDKLGKYDIVVDINTIERMSAPLVHNTRGQFDLYIRMNGENGQLIYKKIKYNNYQEVAGTLTKKSGETDAQFKNRQSDYKRYFILGNTYADLFAKEFSAIEKADDLDSLVNAINNLISKGILKITKVC